MTTTSTSITMSKNFRIDEPKFLALSTHFQRMVELSFRKALAHEGNPEAFPLDDKRSSLESVFAHLLQQIPSEKKAPAIKGALAAADTTPTDEPSPVNLHTVTSVQEQMQASPLSGRLTPGELTQITQVVNRSPVNQSSSQTRFQKVELRLLKLKCVQKTKEVFEGLDEPVINGILVHQNGTSSKINTVSLGQFDEKDEKTFHPPISFTTIPFAGSTSFPLALAVTLTLIEKDADDIAQVVQTTFNAVEAVKGQIVDAIDDLLGLSSEGTSSSTSSDAEVTVLVTLLNVVIGALIDLIGKLLVDLIASDPFDPEMVMVAIPSATSLFPGNSAESEDEMVTFTGEHVKGKYVLTYDWRVS